MNWLNQAANGYGIFEQIKGRNNGRVVSGQCRCGHKVTSGFTKDGEWEGHGGRSGPCCTQKDHRRNYMCEMCYNQ